MKPFDLWLSISDPVHVYCVANKDVKEGEDILVPLEEIVDETLMDAGSSHFLKGWLKTFEHLSEKIQDRIEILEIAEKKYGSSSGS